MNADLHTTPEPPYYAVIFSSQRSGTDDHGYQEMGAAMDALARQQPGFLALESARDSDGFGITVSYWRDENAISAWKANACHLIAQERGKAAWYEHYSLRVARVERAYKGPAGR
ncbi:MAG: antibiotic biosynthesis monooxygenase [Mangrovicoccus sp.]|nr:antibiotic biosynthesis monooxygenase [Mangrovicoccus sp.]